jgi:transposase-like protein
MNTSSASSLFDNTEPDSIREHTFINPILWFDDCAGYRVVFCRHEILYRIALNDPLHLALVAVTLRQSELATQVEIAAAFGHSVATQRRWETRYRQHGSDGLQANTPTGRPAKLDRGQQVFVERWFHLGVSNHEMARRLAVSEATIRRALQQAGLRRQTPPIAELPLDAALQAPADSLNTPPPAASASSAAELPLAVSVPIPAEPTNTPAPPASAAPASAPAAVVPAQEVSPQASGTNPDVTATMPCPQAAPLPAPPLAAGNAPANVFTVDCDPADRSGDRALARLGVLQDAKPLFADHQELPRAGVLLAMPVLQTHGGLEVFTRLYETLGPAFYGLRTTVVSLILLALLRIKRPENLKEYSPEQLGGLLGLDRMAEVKTLRRKLTLLAERGKGRELMNELARLRLGQDDDRLAFLYIDGHIREYSGKADLAKAKKAQRSVATCAATDTWLSDTDGSPLLVVTSEMNAGLTAVLEAIVTEAKKLVPAGQRLTVLFDRGGWSPRLFDRLSALGVDIITYRKGKRRPLPRSHFSEHKVSEDGKEKTYWLCDQPRVRVGRLRPQRKRRRPVGEPEYLWLRQITLLREDGRQTMIVTNRTDLASVEVVRRLFRRWRQENYFKYMDAEFALDALVEYGVEEVSQEATRPNPERKRVGKERKKARAEVVRLQAELGGEAQANEEQQRPTMRGFKIAQASLRKQLEEAQLLEQELTEQQRQLPKRVPAKGVKTLKKEKKLIVDAIKIIAYQCETELLNRLGPHYARADDEGRTLLHAAFQSSASMEVTETELRITLAAQSSPHRSEALAKLCRELDAEGVCYPGSGLCVRLAVEGQEPLTP